MTSETRDGDRPDCPDQDGSSSPQVSETQARMGRRALLLGGSLGAAGIFGWPLLNRLVRDKFGVFVARNQRYDGPLERTIRDGLEAAGVDGGQVKGKRVLLKPNLVEPSRSAPHLTTHPRVVVAVADVFRRWGAEVIVGEAPGHVRDTELALMESGLLEALHDARLPFVDLNYDDVVWMKNRGRRSSLGGFFFPRTVAEADVIVSLPKMKTHHWVGVTAAMKNFYGVLPGVKYGWPKNVLHHAGIPETVYDINASLPKTMAVVDGILCMEGDGPIMGTPRPMGVLVMGANLPAVDATVCRLMELDPSRIPYLGLAAGSLGPIDDRLIEQRGERWQELAQPFEILDQPHLRRLRRRRLWA